MRGSCRARLVCLRCWAGHHRRGLVLVVRASLLTAHSDKERAAPELQTRSRFHSFLVCLDRPDVSGGEALAAILRPSIARPA